MTGAAWDLAGVTTERGGLDRPAAEGMLAVPSPITIETDSAGAPLLVCPSPCARHERRPPSTVLVSFITLADADDGVIRGWAARHGLLHWRSGVRYEKPYAEPIQGWRAYARAARGILDAASSLHRGAAVTDTTLDALEPAFYMTGFPGMAVASPGWRAAWQEPVRARWELQHLVNRWLILGEVRPALRWTDTRPTFHLRATTLLGVLAVQLTLAAAAARGFAVCSECGAPYTPNRRPPTGRNHFCPDCGIRAAQRRASQRYRQKGASHAQQAPRES